MQWLNLKCNQKLVKLFQYVVCYCLDTSPFVSLCGISVYQSPATEWGGDYRNALCPSVSLSVL